MLVCRRTLVLPCQSFCEAAREGCEPVLQMFNASWPEFLRCSQFTNNTGRNAENTPLCYTPRHARGKLCEFNSSAASRLQRPRSDSRLFVILSSAACGGSDHFLCATGICVPLKLVCNGYNDCDDWSDEADCSKCVLLNTSSPIRCENMMQGNKMQTEESTDGFVYYIFLDLSSISSEHQLLSRDLLL